MDPHRHGNIGAASQQKCRKSWIKVMPHDKLRPPLLAAARTPLMRDDKDPGTLELTLPRKRGRPPKFGYAMSDAQRAARYRARRAGQANHADVRSCSDMVLLDKIRAAVSARDTELAGFLVHVLWQRYPLQLK